MKGLADEFRVVAVDLRGYNLSGKPQGVESYTMPRLASDILAVIQHVGEERAIIVGHDWGGAIAWTVAMTQPSMVEKLIICNLPHFKGLQRELARNPEQQKNSQYARNFQEPNAHLQLTAKVLAEWVADPDAKKLYIDAFEKSDFEAMLNYYKANYPRPPYTENDSPAIKVKCPVLMFHGLEDWALLPGALNDTWKWIDNELTLVTIPDAGHFVQHDASERVTQVMRRWLLDW
jgi:pimeloyl-ACP methyl ester carboxylesterase